ncbi:MAG: restriction endonuclease [Natronomonas sp.]
MEDIQYLGESESPGNKLLQSIRELDPEDFDHFVAELGVEIEWSTVVGQISQEQGVDILAKRDIRYDHAIAIQAKRSGERNTIGSPEIQQYANRHLLDVEVDGDVSTVCATHWPLSREVRVVPSCAGRGQESVVHARAGRDPR